MICPNEKIEMQPVKVESHYGQTVLLDQCPKCGGIWFDKSELYMVKTGQADKIELLNQDILRTPCTIEGFNLICPRDQSKLIQFKDPYFPKDLIIVRCPACDGIWLNRGEFTKYQDFRHRLQQSRLKSSGDKKFDQDIERIITLDENGNIDALIRLGTFLNKPVDEIKINPMGIDAPLSKEEKTIGIALNVLALILRFFIKI